MADVLVSPFMVQARVDESVSPLIVRESTDIYSVLPDRRLVHETQQVAAIRAARDNANRVVGVTSDRFDAVGLSESRIGSWALATAIAESPAAANLYLLRDQNQYNANRYACVEQVRMGRAVVYIRSEEGLLGLAHELIQAAKQGATKGAVPGVTVCSQDSDCLIRSNENGGNTHIPLRGYEFNPRDLNGAPRKRFNHYPSCEVFLAASALEQVTFSNHVIRICHYGMRSRDYAARTLLAAAGHSELPIETVSLGDDAQINKIFSWHTSQAQKRFARDLVREARQRVQ